MTNAIDLRPLVIRDRARRRAASWVATQSGVPEHQVIATHAAIESWSYTDLDCDEYDETFADWAAQQRDVRVILAEAPGALGVPREEALQLVQAILEFRRGVKRRLDGYQWHDEHDPARRRDVTRRRRGADDVAKRSGRRSHAIRQVVSS
ncbi:hypothetical protein [uncultured Microbacterium sp.]|uniref:hypothetical protein n=1 Tax=uncultured Microbacterium sp. TaxID=191216 RepID=UPI0028DB02D0|nr:hypothetical protein [uncultured Microbacterium sp.]